MKTMTRFFSLAALLLAAAGFSACSSDSNTVIDQPEVTPAPKTYSVSIDAAKGDDGSISRALSLDGDNNLTSVWAQGEEVSVYNTTKSEALTGTLVAQAAGANTTLAGTLTGNIEAGDELLLKFCSDSYNSQNGTLAYISKNCDYATATVKVDKVTESAFFVAGAANFVNQQAIIKFTLKDKSTSETINPTAFTISDGETELSLTIPASTYTTNGDGVLYVAFPAAGEAKTITLTATVGSKTYTKEVANITFSNANYYPITVNMEVAGPNANGYEYVDLGIVVNGKKILWATKNVGADSETDYGDYFAFGATEPWYSDITSNNSYSATFTWKSGYESGYVKANAPYYDTDNSAYTKYTTSDGITVLEASDDAAHAIMGGDWYIPTYEEWVALTNNCTSEWTTENGVKGRRFTSKVDGYTDKSIFLPAAGNCGGKSLDYGGECGYYWSATVHSEYTERGWRLYFDSSDVTYYHNSRYFGMTVRGVIRK